MKTETTETTKYDNARLTKALTLCTLADQALIHEIGPEAAHKQLTEERDSLRIQINQIEVRAIHGAKRYVAPGNYSHEEVRKIREENQDLMKQALDVVQEVVRPMKLALASLEARLVPVCKVVHLS